MISSSGKHLGDPVDRRDGVAAGLLHPLLHLAADLLGVRGPRAEHHLHARADVLHGVDQMNDALLAGDPADEEDERLLGVDSVLGQDRRIGSRLVLAQVDPVVDDPHPVVGRSIEGMNVLPHRRGYGDDAVGVLVGGALDPRARLIRGAELLDLPGAVGLQRVRRQDKARPGQLLGETAGEVGVPGVAMDDVHALEHPGHDQVLEHRLLEHLVPGILARQLESRVDPPHGQISVADVLVAEAEDRDVVTPSVCAGQFPGEIFDVDPCAPIHMRRVLVGQDCYPHTRPPGSAKAPTFCARDPARIDLGSTGSRLPGYNLRLPGAGCQ